SSTWSALGSGVVPGYLGGIFALAVNGTKLIAGGDFTSAGSVSVNSLAMWTGSAWQGLAGAGSGVRTYSGSQEGVVDALLVQGATLYVGGSFDRLQPGGAATPGGLASFNLNSPAWTVLPMEQAPAAVGVIAPNPLGGVFVGGSFETAGPL